MMHESMTRDLTMHVSMINTCDDYIIDAYIYDAGGTLSVTEEEKKETEKTCCRGIRGVGCHKIIFVAQNNILVKPDTFQTSFTNRSCKFKILHGAAATCQCFPLCWYHTS